MTGREMYNHVQAKVYNPFLGITFLLGNSDLWRRNCFD